MHAFTELGRKDDPHIVPLSRKKIQPENQFEKPVELSETSSTGETRTWKPAQPGNQ